MTPPLPPTGHADIRETLPMLDACIHCGFCLPACPTYAATGSEAESPRGRLFFMRDLLSATPEVPGRFSAHAIAPYLDHCLGCLACQSVCPSGVPYGRVLHASRELLAEQRPMTPARRLKRWAMRHALPRASAMTWLRRALRLYQHSGLQTLTRCLRVLSPLPALAQAESLLPSLPPHRALSPGMTFGPATGERVALPTGCVMDVFYNPTHWATIRVLVACGFQVVIPPSGCCGALADHGGERDIADERARATIEAILGLNPRWIVLNSAGCGSTMRDYAQRFAHDPQWAGRAEQFSAMTCDVSVLLATEARERLACVLTRPVMQTVAYHAACHLHHSQGVHQAPTALLAMVPGLTLVPLGDATTCCGSAGVYNVEHPMLANDILAEKMRHVLASGARVIATGNPGCLLQLAKGLRDAGHGAYRVCHPIDLLAEALDPAIGV